MAFVGQLDACAVVVGGVPDAHAVAPQGENVAVFQPVLASLVQGNDLVLAGVHAVAVDRDDLTCDRSLRSAGNVVDDLSRRHRGQLVANADLLTDARHGKGIGHDLTRGARAFARELGGAEVEGFVSQDLAGGGIFQRLRLTEDTEVAGVADVASHVGQVATRQQDTTLLGAHDTRRARQLVALEDDRFVEEGLDQVQRNGRDAVLVEIAAANPGRQPHGAIRPDLTDLQRGPAIGLHERQDLPGVDQVRVADLLQVHAPQLRPAPGALEVHAGDVPQRVARLDGVDVGRVVGQLGQRHAGLGDLLGRAALLAGDREVGFCGPCRAQADAERHGDRRSPEQGQGRTGASGHERKSPGRVRQHNAGLCGY